MLRPEPKPFYRISPGGHGALMARARARRMGVVALMLGVIVAVPILLFVAPSVF